MVGCYGSEAMKNTTLLRQYFFEGPILALPVAHDPLVARLLEDSGFRAVCVGGYATTAALLGLPDVGLVDRSQVVDAAARTVDAVSVPVFADADTGYGGPASVVHTVRQFERAGVAGLFIEDQTSPKRCGHMAGKDVLPAADMRAKIRAAADARHDDDFVLMARTDALAVHGTDAALERMHSYIASGADVAFVEAPPSKQALRSVAQELPAPAMANMIPGGSTPLCSEQELSDFGYAAVAYPTVATYAITAALRRTFSELRASGDIAAVTDQLVDFDTFNTLVGLPTALDTDQRYLDNPPRAAGRPS